MNNTTKNPELEMLIKRLKEIQDDFYKTFGVTDIISNSKIFEIIIANDLEHILIPGHSGSRDAKDDDGEEYEYKHYKESSSNHTWTFNDYTDATIEKLGNIKSVIFAHIDDSEVFPRFDWYYDVPGKIISDYLKEKTKPIKNARKMINVSSTQIEDFLDISKIYNNFDYHNGRYFKWLDEIYKISKKIESITGTKEVLTSNKFWEILVALILGHKVLSEQLGHDAIDNNGNYFEYKVAKNYSWNFQDISKKVLEKYKTDNKMILAVVDKDNFIIKEIYEADPIRTIRRLKQKLLEKKKRFKERGKNVRRLQASLSAGDLKRIRAKLVHKATIEV
ncbi:hypothetical protein GYA13_03875 [Candidatus Kuenenbacteria bacterium]|nr:hypothetical protein [Candidatus Kuenenbacteria bacterium]